MFAKAAFKIAVAIACMPGALLSSAPARAESQTLPNGQTLTPTAARGAIFAPLDPHVAAFPTYVAGQQAVSTAISPDGSTLLVLTSGYNLLLDGSGHVIWNGLKGDKPYPAVRQGTSMRASKRSEP